MKKKKLSLTILLLVVGFFVCNYHAVANSSGYQRCEPNSSCVVGEYVFDNDYNPVSSNVCTIDINDPSGNLVIDNGATTYNSDGWHSYTYSVGSTEGLYHSLLCCTISAADSACLDESFVVGASFDTLDDVNLKTDLIRDATFDFAGNADAGSSNITLVDSELTQPDDYWKNYKLQMLSGSNFGQERAVSGFSSSGHVLTFSPAMTNSVGAGDKYVLKHEDKLIYSIWNATARTLTSATNVAQDIWLYTGDRTLTSMANTAGDLWNYTGGRTLTAFGTLAADVWNTSFAPNRKLTTAVLDDGGAGASIATISELNTAKSDIITQVNENETLLDQMKTDLLAASNDNKALIQALNNVSAQDIWTYSNRSSNLTD
ncbi:MAG: hypothetical protein PHW24_03200, partial [Candidatus Moranbacteria bacterium]|nr:hypothetical protein [Candidatus Moranbacteria bacterium]